MSMAISLVGHLRRWCDINMQCLNVTLLAIGHTYSCSFGGEYIIQLVLQARSSNLEHPCHFLGRSVVSETGIGCVPVVCILISPL